MEEFAALMTKGDSYVTEKNAEDKKTPKASKRCVMEKTQFENYKYCLEAI